MDFLIHGIHDGQTLQTILSKNVPRVGFDLRGRSLNLISFNTLLQSLQELKGAPFHLVFENDKESTILSFLDLLRSFKSQVILEFRDQLPADFYRRIDHNFFWFFHPQSEWKTILEIPKLKGLVLPMEWKSFYRADSSLWATIERRGLEVFIHASTVSELDELMNEKNIKLSFDLNRELESSYRRVDQEKLGNLKVWRMRNENSVGQ